jgi:hypothetical protein
MFSMIRAMANLCIVAALATLLPVTPSYAENFEFVSATGMGNPFNGCPATSPCPTVNDAYIAFGPPVRIICLSASQPDVNTTIIGDNGVVDIDCPQGATESIKIVGVNTDVRIQHIVFRNGGFTNQIFVGGSGTLILEDCKFAEAVGVALDVEPSGTVNLVVRNSRISSGGSGILLKPAAGGSIKARLDHVTITDNAGGGIKIDTTNGPVTIDIADSVVSDNGGNGINAIGNAGRQAIVSIKNSVIAGNGAAGVQANGVNAGMLIATTLLDQNAAGATSVVNGGNMFTYGNNQIVGSPGSGFNHTAGLQ